MYHPPLTHLAALQKKKWEGIKQCRCVKNKLSAILQNPLLLPSLLIPQFLYSSCLTRAHNTVRGQSTQKGPGEACHVVLLYNVEKEEKQQISSQTKERAGVTQIAPPTYYCTILCLTQPTALLSAKIRLG